MSKVETDVFTFKDDVGKNLYRKTTYYTLKVEQDVLAKDKDEADTKFSDHGGINHSKIGKDITDANEGVETYMVDANYVESDDTKFIGKVKYDTDTYNQTLEEAIEAQDIHIDTWAEEDEPKQMTVAEAVEVGQKLKKEQEQEQPFMVTGLSDKEDSDIDIALNLEAESKRGK